MYTSIACIYCQVMKDFFKNNKIEFEEIDILEDDEVRDEVLKKSGLSSIPIIEIEGQFYTAADKEKIIEVLK